METQPGRTVALADPDRWCAEFLAPLNDHDPDAAANYYAEDGVWEFTVGHQPWGTRYVGRRAIREAIAEICRQVPDISYDLVRHHVGPEHLVMEVLVTGTTVDGEQLHYRACDVVTLIDEKVAAKCSYRKVVS